MIRGIFLLSILFLAGSCGKKSDPPMGSGPNPSPSPSPTPDPSLVTMEQFLLGADHYLYQSFKDNTEPLYSQMKAICQAAGGHFTDERCVCPGNSQIDFGQKACVQFENTWREECIQPSGILATSSDIGKLNECLRWVVKHSDNRYRHMSPTALTLSLSPELQPSELEKVRAWLLDAAAHNKLNAPLWGQVGLSDALVIHVGPIADAQLPLEAIRTDPFVRPVSDDYPYPVYNIASFNSIRLVDNLDELSISLSGTPRPSQSLPEPTEFAKDSPVWDLYFEYKRSVVEDFKAAFGKNDFGDDCLTKCTVIGQPYFDQTRQRLSWRERVYLAGIIVQDRLLVVQSGETLAMMYLDPATHIPSFSVLNRIVSQDNVLQFHNIFLSKAWSIVKQAQEKNLDLLKFQAYHQQILTRSLSEDRLQRGQGVIMCEPRPVPDSMAEYVVHGPHPLSIQGDRPQGSLFGWYANEEQRWDLGLSGYELVGLNDLTTDFAFDRDTDHHAENVAQLIIEPSAQKQARILPLGSSCFAKTDTWRKKVDFAKTRTVNLSLALRPEAPHSCQTLMRNALEQTRAELVWVFAAGNTKLLDPVARPCPQAVSGVNSLIVSGISRADGSEYWDFTNLGTQYSDIAALAHAYDGSKGTSNAAPRVARASSIIAQTFPDLPALAIVNAIILGAEIPSEGENLKFLLNKSGGFLNLERSLKIAGVFQQQGYWAMSRDSYMKLLSQIYQSEGQMAADADRRVAQIVDYQIKHKALRD